MISVFLGAGFSFVGGVPLAARLFDEAPLVDRIRRHQLVERVRQRWLEWNEETGGTPEEYLSYLEEHPGHGWLDAVNFVSLVIALKMGRVELVGLNPKIVRHNINRTTQIGCHEEFWSLLFRQTFDVAVITTNYDILPERGLRHELRPRVPRPGFHYGQGNERLEGGGYPSYAHIHKITVNGMVPLLKLHGSISWSFKNSKIIKYHDCRPAIRGDVYIVAPVTAKQLPEPLYPIWENAASCLRKSDTWIFIGYSLPSYDELVAKLLVENSGHKPTIHVLDPDPSIFLRYERLLGLSVNAHPGLPEGINSLAELPLKLSQTG